MHLAVDVDYRDARAVAAGVLFRDFRSEAIAGSAVAETAVQAAYVPGAFFRRELPPLLALLRRFDAPQSIVVDGYVWLGRARPGLGAHLYKALGRGVPVIGVAKRRFAGNDAAVPVLRGASARPLFVTSAGIDVGTAAEAVRTMAGPFRMPTLLRAVDQLARR